MIFFMINNKYGNIYLKKINDKEIYYEKILLNRWILSFKFKIYKVDIIVLYFLFLYILVMVYFDWKVKLILFKKFKVFYVFCKVGLIKFL